MKTLAMAGVLTVGVVMALPATARAGWHVTGGIVIAGRDDGRDYRGDWRGGGPAFRYGYDRGWREGSDEGYKDGRRSRDPRFWREDDFRDGDRGYKGWMGPRWDYVKGYREGYQAGYRRAYASSRPGWRERDRWGRDRYDGRYDRDDRFRYDDRDWPRR